MLISRPKYQLRPDDRDKLDLIPPLSILLGGFLFLFGVFFSIFTYKTAVSNEYQFLDQFLSELGIRYDYMTDNGEMRYAPVNHDIFNNTLYACGVLMIPFFVFSFRQFRNHNRASNWFLVIATICGVLAGPFMIGVGIFDLSIEALEVEIWQEHGFWASGLYLMIMITAIAWFFMLILAVDLPYRTSKWVWMDYILLITLVFMVIINILDGLHIVFANDIPLVNNYPVQTYQKLIAILFFVYFGLIVGVRLTNTKYDNTPIKPKTSSISSKSQLYCVDCGMKNPASAPHCTECGGQLS